MTTSQEAIVDIGNEVKLWFHCMGQGNPTMILEGPGPGCDSEPWMTIQSRLAQLTQTCRYDRAGTGKSGGAELQMPVIPPRTQDLEKLLQAVAIEPPYIMVGYSLGGAIVLRYARQHLDRIAGLVLIESAVEQFLPRIPSDTAIDINELPSLADIPLVVVTIDTQEYVLPPIPNVSSEEALKIWLAAQSELATLSARGKQIFVKNANHYSILDSHREDVISAITMVLDEVRK
jgi:pimeloyl-ACP methyl ester carboxylesterase